VVACDGGNSFTRDRLAVGQDDYGFSEPWMVCDFRLKEDGGADIPKARQVCDPRQPISIISLGPRHHRFSFMLDSEDSFSVEREPDRVWARVAGYVDRSQADLIRVATYTFRSLVAEHWRRGRILLAGDAAHLFPSPGVALNADLLDAVNLAWKLAAAIDGWAPAGLLDTYHDERHLAGERTLLHTRAQVAMRRGHDPAADALRELFQELLADEQPLRRIGAFIAGTDIRYPPPGPDRHALTGTFAPDLTLHTDQGTTSVAALMHAARPVLLDLADRADLRATARDWQHRIDIHTVAADHRPADALLIRPDAHIAWAASIDEPHDDAAPALRDALSAWFGSAQATAAPTMDRAR
jgi:hypothetical protein